MDGVKETLCTRCAHKDVCKYKEQFLVVQEKLDEVEFTVSGVDDVWLVALHNIPWLHADLRCDYYLGLVKEESKW